VRDKNGRLPESVCEGAELPLQLEARDWIERAERLVEQEERRVERERPGHTDPLALTAGQLMRVAGSEHIRLEADELEQLAHALCDAGDGPPLESRQQTDVCGDGEVGEQADLLNHVPDAASQRRGLDGSDRLPGDADLTARRLERRLRSDADACRRRSVRAAQASHRLQPKEIPSTSGMRPRQV
jgi:hypothetical protein